MAVRILGRIKGNRLCLCLLRDTLIHLHQLVVVVVAVHLLTAFGGDAGTSSSSIAGVGDDATSRSSTRWRWFLDHYCAVVVVVVVVVSNIFTFVCYYLRFLVVYLLLLW